MAPPIEYMLVSVAIGAIVGLVNEYRKIGGSKVFMGLRTSIFISLMGYATVLLYQVIQNPAVIPAGIAAIVVVATAVYAGRVVTVRSVGATTYVAMILLYFAGALAGLGLYEYGFALAVLLAALSLYKTELLGAISRIRRDELIAVVNLLVISAVILPMLPNEYIGPYGIFNPYGFWLTVVVVGTIFFAQYVTLRATRRGLFAFTMIGGIISSTTVTVSLIELANRRRDAGTAAALNIAASNIPMIIFQVAVVLYLVGGVPALAAALPPLTAALAASVVIAAVGRGRLSPEGVEPPRTPLPVLRTVEFAALLFVITASARAVGAALPQALPATITASALANVLSSVYAVGTLYSKAQITAAAAGRLAALAAISGAAVKVGLAALIRDRRTAALTAGLSAAVAAAMAVVLLWT